MIKKALPREGFRNAFLSVGKPYKTNGKRGFSECKKRIAKTLIKPVENEAFWAPFARIALKMIKKALPREGFRNAFPKRRKAL